MAKIRRNAWTLHLEQGLWNDTMLWYAKAVDELRKRPLGDPNSWRFFAAIHDFNARDWASFGAFDPAQDLPLDQGLLNLYWAQCRHGDWFFLPWHRGYLGAFERIVRDAIVGLGGPADWALPYWNYNREPRTGEFPDRIPPCFLEATLPDGSDNPLASDFRHGLGANGVLQASPGVSFSDRTALMESQFLDIDPEGSSGFGGLATGSGELELSPHNIVHTLIGGEEPAGLMSNTTTAGLDPVFWLHHANIDRLWEVWLNRSESHVNPDPNSDYATRTPAKDVWARGAAQLRFVLPGIGGEAWVFDPGQMMDTEAQALDYVYDDISDPYPSEHPLRDRMFRLGVPRERMPELRVLEKSMKHKKSVELLGASDRPLRLGRNGAETSLRIDSGVSKTLQRSFHSRSLLENASPQMPDRAFLNLENVRGTREASILKVYLNLPPNADPDAHPECLAGAVSLFGLRMATRAESIHGGNGLRLKLEITDHLDALGLDTEVGLDDLRVALIPQTPLNEQDEISIGRISVYRQEQ